MPTNKDTSLRLGEIIDDLTGLLDRLEELAEDDEAVSKPVNRAIDLLSSACDALEELE